MHVFSTSGIPLYLPYLQIHDFIMAAFKIVCDRLLHCGFKLDRVKKGARTNGT